MNNVTTSATELLNEKWYQSNECNIITARHTPNQIENSRQIRGERSNTNSAVAKDNMQHVLPPASTVDILSMKFANEKLPQSWGNKGIGFNWQRGEIL